MSHYKPYPAYKDSGVEWLGRIPEHWEITPLKYEAEFVNGAAFKPEQWSEIGTPIIRIENLNGSLNFNCFDGEMDARYHVEQGDLLFGWSGNRGTSFGPFIWQHAGRHYLNQHIFRICNFKFDKAWFYWSLKAVTAHVEDQAHGIIGMVHITKGDLGAIKIATPAPAEQQAISVHLNRETARIDALIEKKTRFIELLLEKRQALITHAVTRGLDPSVKMKDSGLEWLGEVPEHWDALPLRRVVTAVKTGGTPSEEQPSPDADGLAWYTPGDFGNSLVLTSSEKRVSALAVSTGEAKVYPAGAVLVVSIGATLGKVGYLVESASANQQINAVIPNSRVSGYFLAYSLSVKTEAMWFLANAATIGIMNQEKTKEIWLAVPSPSEQKAITEYLDKGTGRLDSLIGKTERSIELLKERRSALITAAVTGQIDLREAV